MRACILKWVVEESAFLTAEAYSGGAERRQNVAHGVSRGFPGAPHASPGGATENLAQGALLQLIAYQWARPWTGVNLNPFDCAPVWFAATGGRACGIVFGA